jgi:hypothetical protein
VGIRKIRVQYGQGGSLEEQMELEGRNGLFSGLITLPSDDDSDMDYRFNVLDMEGNTIISGIRTISVIDSVSPEIVQIEDLSVSTKTNINVIVEVSDNIELDSVTWSGAPIQPVENTLKGNIPEPGSYQIIVTAVDMTGNSATMSFRIEVSNPDGIEDEDEEDIPLWAYIPLMIAVLLMICSFIFMRIRRRTDEVEDLNKLHTTSVQEQEPISDGIPQDANGNEIEGMDELDRLFNS